MPEDAGGLRNAVVELCDNPGLASRMGESGKAHVAEHYDRRVLAGRFLNMMEELVAEGR